MTTRLPYSLQDPVTLPVSLGLIVLQVDETIESDFKRLMPEEGVRLLHNRIPSPDAITPETLPEMGKALPRAAALFPPQSDLSVIAYACTSGTAAMGEPRIEAQVRKGFPGVAVTNPLSALKAALASLGLTRVALVSPYMESVSDEIRARLLEAGVRVTSVGSFNQTADRLVARINPASVLKGALAMGDDENAEGVLISCTALPAVAVLKEAQERLGKPVLASNQALAWHMLRLAGIETAQPQLGCLAEAGLVESNPAMIREPLAL